MKPLTCTHKVLLAFVLFTFIAGNSIAQQKNTDPAKGKKTITIHVTKEADGNTIQIDTTFVANGDFDTDTFLQEKGITLDEEAGKSVEKKIIINNPESKEFTWTESDGDSPDTLIIKDSRVIILSDNSGMHGLSQQPGMQFHSNQIPPCFSPMQGPPPEHMIEGMMRAMGLENMMPFGNMENIVVKKKRNGKKVIITFEDNDKTCCEHAKNSKQEQKVIIYNNGEQGMAPQNEERYIVKGVSGETIIIDKNVETKGNEKTVTIRADVDKPAPVQKEKKIVIIKEEEIK